MKYKVEQLIEVVIYPENINMIDVNNVETKTMLKELLGNGYEIYKAIPLTTSTIGIIKYILRKPEE